MHLKVLLLFFALCLAPAVYADQSTMKFDVRLLGARIGVFTIATNEGQQNYAARSKFATVGLAGALKHMQADVTVQGKLLGGRMQPVKYHEAIDDGTRVTNVQVQFFPGTPRLISGETGSSAPAAPASSLGNAVDPLTGLMVLLRDQPESLSCDFVTDVYDGHRLAQISFNRAEKKGEDVVCHGTYQRVAGYSQSERRSRVVPVAIDYVAHQGGYRADRIRVDTRYGAAVVKRR